MLTATHLFKRGLFTALLLCLATTLFAQGTFSVISTNDGNGQFTWIFSVSGGSYPEVDQFKMKLYGVQDTASPQGWTATIATDDFVTWNYLGTGGAPFTGHQSPFLFTAPPLNRFFTTESEMSFTRMAYTLAPCS